MNICELLENTTTNNLTTNTQGEGEEEKDHQQKQRQQEGSEQINDLTTSGGGRGETPSEIGLVLAETELTTTTTTTASPQSTDHNTETSSGDSDQDQEAPAAAAATASAIDLTAHANVGVWEECKVGSLFEDDDEDNQHSGHHHQHSAAASAGLTTSDQHISNHKMMMFSTSGGDSSIFSSSSDNDENQTHNNNNNNNNSSNMHSNNSQHYNIISNDENSNMMSNNENQNANQYSIMSNPIDDECLLDNNPIEKFFKLCESPNPSNIETASKYVVPALEFANSQEEYVRIFSYLRQYCFYSDVLLRSLWLEQIQSVIQYLHQELDNIRCEFSEDFNMPYTLAVLINDLMREQAYQVKKCATASILFIIEKQLLNNSQIEQLIIPSLLNLVKENNEDFHIDCVSLFGKLAPLVGHELTSKYFLKPFCRLCSSSVFHTRKACAANIVDIANVISIEEVEDCLLPHFCEFMKDQVWAIRKVCADTFSSFAARCTRETRENVLTEFFIRLLDDNSRWVKISAYKSLGPFIATFIQTEAEKDELKNKKTQASLGDTSTETIKNDDNPSDEAKAATTTTTTAMASNDVNMLDTSVDSDKEEAQDEEKEEDGEKAPTITSEGDEVGGEDAKKEGEYTEFMFWRMPLVDDGNNKNETTTTTDTITSRTKMEASSSRGDEEERKTSTSTTTLDSPVTPTLANLLNNSNLISKTNIYSSTSNLYASHLSNSPTSSIEQLTMELKQDIIPPILLSHFIAMVDINSQNSLDSEMNYNCAFNFPAIALTLGVEYWKYIKNLYKKLAEDVSWKVRQTLAYSIHELAIILGTTNTQTDLVPIFDSYIKDVDEVRIGIVANLTKFLRVLTLDYRRSYMPKLNDFLKMDNQRNWRFRNELGLQIAQFCELFPSECLAEFVQPVAFTLALDKISEVRLTAIKALIEIYKQFEITDRQDFKRNFTEDAIRTFANSNRWSFRQLYVILCENILKQKAYKDFTSVCKDFIPKLLSLRNEKVPNIRVIVARVTSTYLVNHEYFLDRNNPLYNELELTVQYLAGDKDMDVRNYFQNIKSDLGKQITPTEEAVAAAAALGGGDTLMEIVNDKAQLNSSELVDSSSLTSSDPSPSNKVEESSPAKKSSEKISYSLNSPNTMREDVDNEEEDDDDDDDDEDEIIDQTKINQLKIVNLENEMEDEMDVLIESKEQPLTNHHIECSDVHAQTGHVTQTQCVAATSSLQNDDNLEQSSSTSAAAAAAVP